MLRMLTTLRRLATYGVGDPSPRGTNFLAVLAGRAAKRNRERTYRARILAMLVVCLYCAPAQAALAQAGNLIGSVTLDGPSARFTVGLVDPTPCDSTEGQDWPPFCLVVTDGGTHALVARLVLDPAQAYYDADEDLVQPYRGVVVWQGGQGAAPVSVGSATLELTATKEGHEAGALAIALDGLDQIPVGTTLNVELVASDQS